MTGSAMVRLHHFSSTATILMRSMSRLFKNILCGLVPSKKMRRSIRNKHSPQVVENYEFLNEKQFNIYVPDLGVFYRKIPKAACSKVTETFVRHFAPQLDLSSYVGERGMWYGGVHVAAARLLPNLSSYDNETLQRIANGDVFRFTFVRNPYDRLISGYVNKMVELPKAYRKPEVMQCLLSGELNEYMLFFYRMQHAICQTMKVRPRSPYAKDFEPVPFEHFVRHVCSLPDRSLDPHFQSQCHVGRFDCIEYDFIGRVENFEHDMAHVLDQIGAPERLREGLNKRSNSTGANSKRGHYYTPELKKLVYDRFQGDFEEFGYAF